MSKSKGLSSAPTPVSRLGQALGRLARAVGSGGGATERRTERRVPAHGSVILRWLEAGRGEKQTVAHVIDASPEGVAVRCSLRIPVAQAVSLRESGTDFSGIVRHCTQDGREFRIGLAIRQRGESAP